MTERSAAKKSTRQLSYGRLKNLVSVYDQRCNNDKQAIRYATNRFTAFFRRRLKRPSSLGIAFVSGFTTETLKQQRFSKSPKDNNSRILTRPNLPVKVKKTVFTLLLEWCLSHFD